MLPFSITYAEDGVIHVARYMTLKANYMTHDVML